MAASREPVISAKARRARRSGRAHNITMRKLTGPRRGRGKAVIVMGACRTGPPHTLYHIVRRGRRLRQRSCCTTGSRNRCSPPANGFKTVSGDLVLARSTPLFRRLIDAMDRAGRRVASVEARLQIAGTIEPSVRAWIPRYRTQFCRSSVNAHFPSPVH